MSVTHITSTSHYHAVTATKGLVVVDFSAGWCGPCRMIGPHFEAMAAQHPDVTFAKDETKEPIFLFCIPRELCRVFSLELQVQEDDGAEGKSIVAAAGISAFPTFFFFIDGSKRDEMKGANPATLQEKVAQWHAAVPQSFAGSGATLGGGGAQLDAAAAREARLKKLGGGGGSSAAPPSFTLDMNAAPAAAGSGTAGANSMENDDDAGLQAALALSMNDAPSPTAGAAAAAESPVAPPPAGSGEGAAEAAATTASQSPEPMDEGSDHAAGAATTELPPVDAKLLNEGTAMGFPELQVRKALMAGCSNLDAAVTWVLEHGSDANIDDPIPPVAKGSSGSSSSSSSADAGSGQVQQSWKCVETGRLFRTMEEVQMYAEKTGRSNFAESTEEKKPLTEEEKAAKLLELKAKIAAKREAAGEIDKVDEVLKEKQRRTMGKETTALREQMEKEARQREFAAAKREKEAQKRERERLKAEIEKDKAERRARGGTLNSVLGKDGYNPSGLMASISKDDEKAERAERLAAASSSESAPSKASKSLPAAAGATGAAAVDTAIASICKYKVGGDGGKCLALLNLFLKNVVEKPTEDKYRSINTESNAFKSKVAGLAGGIGLLKAVGFVKAESSLELSLEARDLDLVSSTRTKLAAAIEQYNKESGK